MRKKVFKKFKSKEEALQFCKKVRGYISGAFYNDNHEKEYYVVFKIEVKEEE